MAVPDKPLTEAEMARSLLLVVDPAWALGWTAEPPQAQFLAFTDVDEALYGGARQGGKSDALLMFSIARRTAHPGSKGLILRRTLADLSKEGALISRSHELLTGIATYHTQEHKWRCERWAFLRIGIGSVRPRWIRPRWLRAGGLAWTWPAGGVKRGRGEE